MCPEIGWDAPSRFGAPGRVARRILERGLRPALVRQAAVNADLREQLERQSRQILALRPGADSGGGPGDLGYLQYRVDVLERRYELAQARSLLQAATMPAEG